MGIGKLTKSTCKQETWEKRDAKNMKKAVNNALVFCHSEPTDMTQILKQACIFNNLVE